VDRRILTNKNALRMPISTLDGFAYTMDEIFQIEYNYELAPFRIPVILACPSMTISSITH
jgi:hypothetical protein